MNDLRRVPLFDRLPEIYRTRDALQAPADQLRAFLGALEGPFSDLHENIAQLYEDLYIDTCDDWVIPYLADLLGSSHLKGDPRTLRADVADTIALRRRKGTLGAIERLAYNLTGWTCRGVELRENLGWSQHLNHQRPDAGGEPPYANPALTGFHVPRGGTAPLRDPAALALLGTPFDNFAYTADVKPPVDDQRHINLPTWRSSSGAWPPIEWRACCRSPKAAPTWAPCPQDKRASRCASTCIRWTCRCACSTAAGPASCRRILPAAWSRR